jgi:hypothetical protein
LGNDDDDDWLKISAHRVGRVVQDVEL